ncbi:alpha/beta-hydrolase [Aureobasidium sp. EXF-8845]|nr:alpha/beta-hydrolase [Aureobasidium sp. EXF-8845]KAI4855630.1 alpha/beta-hydrolase [Aureobasidium sp. EXF-8846]
MSSIALLALLGVASAAKVCTNVTVPVNINARQAIFDVPTFESNFDAVKFSLDFTNIGQNYTDVVTKGFENFQGNYNISAKYCKPQGDHKANPTVQVLTHGIGFDKSYWDLSYNNYNYSYIDVAVAAGYHTVSIDRFGIGNSSHADPLQVQAPGEVSALYEITSMLRNGTFPTVSHKFGKVVHVGHSFGSLQSYLLTALYPGSSDGVVLTGFSMNGTWLGQTLADWNLHLARLNQPLRFGDISSVSRTKNNIAWFSQGLVSIIQSALSAIGINLSTSDIWQEIATTEIGDIINGWNTTVIAQNLPTGYLTWSDLTSNIFAFLYPGYFDVGAALFAESTKQPVTLGEIFTLANGAPATSPHKGPALVLTGRRDTIYCGGDCEATGTSLASIPAGVAKAFPNASKFEAYIHPNTGHGINFHYNATGAYNVIQNFFNSNGLASS